VSQPEGAQPQQSPRGVTARGGTAPAEPPGCHSAHPALMFTPPRAMPVHDFPTPGQWEGYTEQQQGKELGDLSAAESSESSVLLPTCRQEPGNALPASSPESIQDRAPAGLILVFRLRYFTETRCSSAIQAAPLLKSLVQCPGHWLVVPRSCGTSSKLAHGCLSNTISGMDQSSLRADLNPLPRKAVSGSSHAPRRLHDPSLLEGSIACATTAFTPCFTGALLLPKRL